VTSEQDERLADVAARLRAGATVADEEVDLVYPPTLRAASRAYFSPVVVARRAAELLVESPATRVMDVGSGAGKFCLVGALTTGASFVGVERRARLVDVAEAAARRLGVNSVRFVVGGIDAIDPAEHDALYFFNPFLENLWPAAEWLDAAVELSPAQFDRDVALALGLLGRARAGMRVATYNGIGVKMPETYRLLAREWHMAAYLDLWVKD
jgi:SAM-dependent methyltransferase